MEIIDKCVWDEASSRFTDMPFYTGEIRLNDEGFLQSAHLRESDDQALSKPGFVYHWFFASRRACYNLQIWSSDLRPNHLFTIVSTMEGADDWTFMRDSYLSLPDGVVRVLFCSPNSDVESRYCVISLLEANRAVVVYRDDRRHAAIACGLFLRQELGQSQIFHADRQLE